MSFLLFLSYFILIVVIVYLQYQLHKFTLLKSSNSRIIDELKALISLKNVEVQNIQSQFQEAQKESLNLSSKIKTQLLEISELKISVNTLENAFQKKELEYSKKLKIKIQETRKETLKKSRAVLRGQATEHLAPYILKDTNPKDYRFLGNPIDYIYFEGLSDILDSKSDSIPCVHFIDIKTGKSSLNKTQRRIRDAINDGRVKFSTINLDEQIQEQNDKTRIQQEIKSAEKS